MDPYYMNSICPRASSYERSSTERKENKEKNRNKGTFFEKCCNVYRIIKKIAAC